VKDVWRSLDVLGEPRGEGTAYASLVLRGSDPARVMARKLSANGKAIIQVEHGY
jgi:hypothetical protein